MDRDFIICSPGILMGPKEDWKAVLALFSGITQHIGHRCWIGNQEGENFISRKSCHYQTACLWC